MNNSVSNFTLTLPYPTSPLIQASLDGGGVAHTSIKQRVKQAVGNIWPHQHQQQQGKECTDDLRVKNKTQGQI